MSAPTAEIRRMVRVLKLAFNAGTSDEAVASLETFSKQLSRQGIDTGKDEDLIKLLTLGFHGKGPVGLDPNSPEFRRQSASVVNTRNLSKKALRRHEGSSHPNIIRVLNLNINCPEFTDTETKLIRLLSHRRPMRISIDEWDVVETMLVKAGLSQYVPDYVSQEESEDMSSAED